MDHSRNLRNSSFLVPLSVTSAVTVAALVATFWFLDRTPTDVVPEAPVVEVIPGDGGLDATEATASATVEGNTQAQTEQADAAASEGVNAAEADTAETANATETDAATATAETVTEEPANDDAAVSAADGSDTATQDTMVQPAAATAVTPTPSGPEGRDSNALTTE